MAGRGAWIFISTILIMGMFAFAYMLAEPLFSTAMSVVTQLAPWNSELHGYINLVYAILPVSMLLGGVLVYVLVESNAANDE